MFDYKRRIHIYIIVCRNSKNNKIKRRITGNGGRDEWECEFNELLRLNVRDGECENYLGT